MIQTLMTATIASISEVMETMFYLPVEVGHEKTLSESWKDKKNRLACQLKFSGDFSGHFILVIHKDLLMEMTENFMGESQETLEEEHILGTLTETLNMICGNSLSKLTTKIPFELNIPEILKNEDLPESKPFTIINTPDSMMGIHITID